MTATSIVSRAEVAAALAKAVRTGLVTHDVARNAQRSFAGDWQDLVRVAVTEALVERADTLAWEHGLRGYDAVQLASALTWQESVGEEIVLATFDQQLWEAAKRTGLKPWPGTVSGRDERARRPAGQTGRHVVKMKPPEALAGRVIEAVEAGACMTYREDQSIRTHDFDLHRPAREVHLAAVRLRISLPPNA